MARPMPLFAPVTAAMREKWGGGMVSWEEEGRCVDAM